MESVFFRLTQRTRFFKLWAGLLNGGFNKQSRDRHRRTDQAPSPDQRAGTGRSGRARGPDQGRHLPGRAQPHLPLRREPLRDPHRPQRNASSFFATSTRKRCSSGRATPPLGGYGYKTFDTLLPKSRYRAIVRLPRHDRPGKGTPRSLRRKGRTTSSFSPGGWSFGSADLVRGPQGESLYFAGEQEFAFANKGKTLVDFLLVRTSGR